MEVQNLSCQLFDVLLWMSCTKKITSIHKTNPETCFGNTEHADKAVRGRAHTAVTSVLFAQPCRFIEFVLFIDI